MNVDDIELRDFFRVPLAVFGFFGIEISALRSDAPPRSWLFRLFSRAVCVKVFGSAVLYMGLYLFYGQPANELDIMANMCYWGFFVLAIVVAVLIQCMMHKLNFVFDGLQSYYPRTAAGRREFQLAHQLQRNNTVTAYIIVYDFVTVAMFSFAPLLQSVLEHRHEAANGQGGEYVSRFPFMFWYPFDVRPWLAYAYAYTIQVLTGYFSSVLFLACDLLMICQVRAINMYFLYLRLSIEKFVPDGSDGDIQRFTPFIRLHSDLKRIVGVVSDIFTGFNLLRFLISGFLMCLLCIQIALGTEFLYLFKFLFFLVATLIHMFFITYAADDLIRISSSISVAYAHHKWYLGNLKYQKMMIHTIAMGQGKCSLKAYKFFDMSIVSFKKLLSVSYQVFALLRSTLDSS